MNKFQTLFSATTESLKERKVSISEILCQVVGLGSAQPIFEDQELPSFRCHILGLQIAKSIDEVMLCIGNYCSFFNYQMMEFIINNLGTKQDKANLEMYKKEFHAYAQRHVFECPSEVGKLSEEDAKMFVKLDDTFKKCKLEELAVFVNKLQDTLKCSFINGFKLCRFDPGCLKLTFQLPFSVLQEIFPLSVEQEAILAGLGVNNLWLIYQFKRQQHQVYLTCVVVLSSYN